MQGFLLPESYVFSFMSYDTVLIKMNLSTSE